MKSLVIAASLIAAIPSAAHARLCADPARVLAKASDCFDNEHLSEAAIECVEGFEASVKAATTGMSAAQAKAAAASKDSQAARQQNANVDYKLSAATLTALLASARAAKAETEVYFKSVLEPEDADEPEITGDDIDAFLNEEACYKDNRDVIQSVLDTFDEHIANLEKAKAASQDLGSGAASNRDEMNNVVPGQGVQLSTPAQPGPGFKGQDERRDSDITGTERLKKETKK